VHPALIERKAQLERIVPADSRLLYARHLEADGRGLFDAVCPMDLEGIVGKWKYGPHLDERNRSTTWVKVLNPGYSQRAGRDEMFKKRFAAEDREADAPSRRRLRIDVSLVSERRSRRSTSRLSVGRVVLASAGSAGFHMLEQPVVRRSAARRSTARGSWSFPRTFQTSPVSVSWRIPSAGCSRS
jgi:hypothetical protein